MKLIWSKHKSNYSVVLLFASETSQQKPQQVLSDMIRQSCMKHHQKSHRTVWQSKQISAHRVTEWLTNIINNRTASRQEAAAANAGWSAFTTEKEFGCAFLTARDGAEASLRQVSSKDFCLEGLLKPLVRHVSAWQLRNASLAQNGSCLQAKHVLTARRLL